MSLLELNLQSGLWQTLLLYDSDSGWKLDKLMDICRTLIREEELVVYFRPGNEEQLRKFLKERPQYFNYDPDEDKVSLPENSTSTVLEECLVEFLALQVKASSGSLPLAEVTYEKYKHLLPKPLAEHMHTIYGGSLLLFLQTHPLSFIICTEGTVRLAPDFDSSSILVDDNNAEVVYFLLGILQKIGATKDKPLSVHLLLKYLPYMEKDAREFLCKEYLNNLNIFFLLNCRYFQTNKPEKCSVYPKYPQTPNYTVVAHLKQQLRVKNVATDGTGLSPAQLAAKGKSSWIPAVQAFFAKAGEGKQLKRLLNGYPNVFKLQPDGKACLREVYSPCERVWNPSLELLTVLYFAEMFKDIGSSSPSNPICFNYVLSCVDSAPEEIKDYLRDAFPGVEIIDLFHLHPNMFDLSSTNCVSLRSPPTEELPHKNEVAEALSIHYAYQLMKYADITPDLFLLCVQTAPSVRPSIGEGRARYHSRLIPVHFGGPRAPLRRRVGRPPRPRAKPPSRPPVPEPPHGGQAGKQGDPERDRREPTSVIHGRATGRPAGLARAPETGASASTKGLRERGISVSVFADHAVGPVEELASFCNKSAPHPLARHRWADGRFSPAFYPSVKVVELGQPAPTALAVDGLLR
ncbi:hypothetical protein IscW_ISCW021204 [Ixodes scapularis]|uniref:Uncharacterized protein n=1 Tax=Ixodes scapularis TaxID=6945 RepID=B7Q5L4_IXOSC|nr:hypothetical protein IscW_ISCW021204 [Ixodes scapularis]|eukprot:XP_002402021.1 hypothetical protein IscW_ISCW021204 [Ixodes scapularis]